MDIKDSSCEKESSFDWKDSCFKHDIIRRVHSTPLVLPKVSSGQNSCSFTSGGSGKSKKLFVSFRQDTEEDYEVRPALSYRSINYFKQLPQPDCRVQLGKRLFRCNCLLLQEFSLLFRQLDIPVNSYIPLMLKTDKQIYPETFWLVYQWMNARKSGDSALEFINLHWVTELYLAAKYLIIQDLEDECYRYLTEREKIKEEKAFYLYLGLEGYEAKDLSHYLVSLIQGCFSAIASTQDFLNMTCDQILQILFSQYIVVSGEVEVFYAGVHWLLDHVEGREVYIEEVMSTVRFHYMDLKQLMRITREFPRITGKSSVSLMVEQAVRIAVLKEVDLNEVREKYLSHLPKPRNSQYRPFHQQVESYREFLHISRRRRERSSYLYHNMNRLNFQKTRFVEDMETFYTTWKINNSWEDCQTRQNSTHRMNNTYS